MARTLTHLGKTFHSSKGSKIAAALLSLAVFAAPALAQSARSADPKCKAGSKRPECQDKSTTPQSPSADPAQKSAGEAFPFPTEDSRRGADAEGTTPTAPRNSLPPMPTEPVPDPPASSERPLKLPPATPGSSSSSSDDGNAAGVGSSSSRSTDDDDVAPTSAPSDAPVKSSALKDLGSRGSTSEARAKLEQTRVADDLKVGSFYMKDGNTQGAYLRFKDAAEHAPDEPEARFNLAEAATRLNKRDEASLNYREYLRLDAGGDHDKAARKALEKLGGSAP